MKKTIVFLFPVLLLACQQKPAGNAPEPVAQTTPAAATTFQPANAAEQAIYSRAFNAVIWGMPAVNFELMHENLIKVKGNLNQMIYWSKPVNAKNQTLTPNPDVIYFNPFYDTRKGPVVLEIPPAAGVSSITGSIDDCWQTAIEDVGPAGVDKGKGGKYLILPPGYKEKAPAGYIPMPSSTYTGFVILRSNLTDGSEADVARAVAYGQTVKIYPYGGSSTAAMDFIDVDFGNVITYNIHFFEALDQFVQREPWITRDMAMIDQLKTIGIEKGKTFKPDSRTQTILEAAINDARHYLDGVYLKAFADPFYENTHWALPVDPSFIKAIDENYSDPNIYPVDSRGVGYSIAYFSAKHIGTGQFYLMSIMDDAKQPFSGAKTYRLHLPAGVPVKLYWSVTAYDRETHALIKGVNRASRSSVSPGLQKNADGSVDVYFGPKAPAGKESNWVPTDAQRGFELLARFYGPEKGFFEKTWKMGNVEEVK